VRTVLYHVTRTILAKQAHDSADPLHPVAEYTVMGVKPGLKIKARGCNELFQHAANTNIYGSY
jgi:hypothetical protein